MSTPRILQREKRGVGGIYDVPKLIAYRVGESLKKEEVARSVSIS